MSKPNSLWTTLVLPDPKAQDYPDRLNAALSTWNVQAAQYMEKILLNNNLSPLRVGTVTLDGGSAAYTCSSAANAKTAFDRLLLPNKASTTSSTPGTVLAYTGKGVLQCVVGVSQNSGSTSTANGFTIDIQVDGVTTYASALGTAVNQLAAAVGQLCVSDSTNDTLFALSDPVGLTFNKSIVIALASGTNGQGVQVGWRVLKLA